MQVLLVEDDDAIAEPLVRGLEREGFKTTRVANGRDALGSAPSDIILLDLGLPDIDGYEVCRLLRSQSDTPIIILTARGDEIDRVVGLELGADDYIVKPFGFRELIARIRAVTRRATTSLSEEPDVDHAEKLTYGPLEIDTRSRRVRMIGRNIALTRKEYDVLRLLASDPGMIRSREEILEEVWDAHWYGPTKTLDVHIASLRKKLGDPGLIETIRGVGYRLRDLD